MSVCLVMKKVREREQASKRANFRKMQKSKLLKLTSERWIVTYYLKEKEKQLSGQSKS